MVMTGPSATIQIRDRTLTVDEVGVVADTLSALKERNPALNVADLIADWHKWMVDVPHEHYMSILGPYCVACRNGIPRSDWNTTRAPQ